MSDRLSIKGVKAVAIAGYPAGTNRCLAQLINKVLDTPGATAFGQPLDGGTAELETEPALDMSAAATE